MDRRDRGACRAEALSRAVTTPFPDRCWGKRDVHHVLPRGRGGTDTLDNLITLCRVHHRWVHDHPMAAVALGLLQ